MNIKQFVFAMRHLYIYKNTWPMFFFFKTGPFNSSWFRRLSVRCYLDRHRFRIRTFDTKTQRSTRVQTYETWPVSKHVPRTYSYYSISTDYYNWFELNTSRFEQKEKSVNQHVSSRFRKLSVHSTAKLFPSWEGRDTKLVCRTAHERDGFVLCRRSAWPWPWQSDRWAI